MYYFFLSELVDLLVLATTYEPFSLLNRKFWEQKTFTVTFSILLYVSLMFPMF